MYEKLSKCSNFTWFLPPKKLSKYPNFCDICPQINKIPEFYIIFAGIMTEFYIIIARKKFFLEFGGGTCPIPCLLWLACSIVKPVWRSWPQSYTRLIYLLLLSWFCVNINDTGGLCSKYCFVLLADEPDFSSIGSKLVQDWSAKCVRVCSSFLLFVCVFVMHSSGSSVENFESKPVNFFWAAGSRRTVLVAWQLNWGRCVLMDREGPT